MFLTNNLVEFICHYTAYNDKEKIQECIKKHLEYQTCIYVTDNNNNIAAVCRWNIEENGKVAYILDLIIRKDFRNKEFIKNLLIKGLIKYPTVEFLVYDREEKYPERKKKYLKVSSLLKENVYGR